MTTKVASVINGNLVFHGGYDNTGWVNYETPVVIESQKVKEKSELTEVRHYSQFEYKLWQVADLFEFCSDVQLLKLTLERVVAFTGYNLDFSFGSGK